VLFRSR